MYRMVVKASRQIAKKPVQGAEDGKKEDTRFDDLSDALNDDFDYALDGFSKMARDGNVDAALSIMESLKSAINDAIDASAAQISQ